MEKKLAGEYLASKPRIALQVLAPYVVYKKNVRDDKIEDFEKMNPRQKDSALFFSSKYLREVDDSVYLETFVNAFLDELKALGFVVFMEGDAERFLASGYQSYVLNIAQIEMEEYILPVEDDEVFGDTIRYYKMFDLDAVDVNTWFELTQLNSGKGSQRVLFGSYMVSDDVEGAFFIDPLTMNVRYKYDLDPMGLTDIYTLARYSGIKYAGHLFDLFMNEYIRQQYPADFPEPRLFHYDRFRQAFTPANDEGFIEMKP